MSRLVCFFSVGTRPQSVAYMWDGRRYESLYVLDAALHLGLVERRGDPVVFIPILTEQTREIGDQMKACFAKDEDGWYPIEVDSAGPHAVERVIEVMLKNVRDGDRVFIEPTNGPRTFEMAFIAGALYLRALRSDVQVERLVYGEITSGAIYDITFLVDLFDWTRDAHAFTDALHAGPLLARLRRERKSKQLDMLEGPLSGGLAPQVFAALRRLRVPEATGVAEREALGLVERRFEPLKSRIDRTKKNTLDLAWLDAEIALVKELADAGRLGDATRALREWCVNVVLLGTRCNERWYTTRGRGPAERWLTQRTGGRKEETPEPLSGLVRLYNQVQRLRNQISHSGYDNGEDDKPPLNKARDHVANAVEWWETNRHHLIELEIELPPPPENGDG